MRITSAVTVAHGVGRAALVSAVVVLALQSAPAAANPQLARDKRCLNCHVADRKLVGPSFKDIARRYANQPGAADRLAAKIIHGGAGVWGPVAMPSNPLVTPTEAKLLATWVLATK